MIRFLCLLLIALMMSAGCKKFETNPYEEKETPGDLNALNLRKLLQSTTPGDSVCFVVAGDSQRFYEQLDLLVDKINTIPDVDFFVLAGDITDFTLAEEFNWICDRLAKLRVPYFCVVGNHDLTVNGPELYQRTFGPLDFSFTFKKHKFIMHNTNSRETGFNGQVPSISFLERELADSLASYYVGVSHVPPFDQDFDPALVTSYTGLLSSKNNFLLSIHGHRHSPLDRHYYGDHVRYLVTPALDDRQAYLVKIINGSVTKADFDF